MQKWSENGKVIGVLGWLRMPPFPTRYLLLDATSSAVVVMMVLSVASCKVKLTIRVMEVNLAVVSIINVDECSCNLLLYLSFEGTDLQFWEKIVKVTQLCLRGLY